METTTKRGDSVKLNGQVMSRDRVVATVVDGSVTGTDERLVPYGLRGGNLEGWLRSRAIDGHRTHSRLLKKALRLAGADDTEVALKFHAATITDSYWWRPEGSGLKYADVRFTFNHFDKLALRGDLNSMNHPESPTPELTNTGSFEKCWRLKDGAWWLYKAGDRAQVFSELFIFHLGRRLGFDMAEYLPAEEGCIKSRDFTEGAAVNFEPAEGLVGTDEDYGRSFEVFYGLDPALAEQFLRIIYLDTLAFNADRHTQNYGVLRDVETGTALRMAPNYDNNIALLAYGAIRDEVSERDLLIHLFSELLKTDARARTLAAALPRPTEAMVRECVRETDPTMDADLVCRIVLNRTARLEQELSGMDQDHTQTPEL